MLSFGLAQAKSGWTAKCVCGRDFHRVKVAHRKWSRSLRKIGIEEDETKERERKQKKRLRKDLMEIVPFEIKSIHIRRTHMRAMAITTIMAIIGWYYIKKLIFFSFVFVRKKCWYIRGRVTQKSNQTNQMRYAFLVGIAHFVELFGVIFCVLQIN